VSVKPILPPWLIRGVAVIGPHRLRLLFEDGTVGDVSFEDHEWNGVFAPLRNPERFAPVSVKWDTLYWAEDELDWAPEPLYEAAKANELALVTTAA
jgi:hypothetical protein